MVEDLEQVSDRLHGCTNAHVHFTVLLINRCGRLVNNFLLRPQGDVAETAKKFFEESTDMPPVKTSTLTLADVG